MNALQKKRIWNAGFASALSTLYSCTHDAQDIEIVMKQSVGLDDKLDGADEYDLKLIREALTKRKDRG